MRQHLDQLWRQVYPDGTPCPTVRPGDIRSRVNAALDAAPSERRQPMRHKTRFAAILTAAAVALGSTALAVTVQWDVLDAFFRGDTSPAETLVDRQAPSANDENYTFTVESSVSDGDTAYLVVRVDALTEDAAAQLYSKYFLNMDTFSVYPVADPEEPIPEDLGVDEQTGCNIPARNAMSMGIREIKQAATQTSRTWQLDVSLDSNEAANYLHARLCYMNRACTIALPLSPAESVTLDIGASGPGSPTSENTQGGTITLESVTLSPFTCQIAARHEDGNKEVDPLIFFLLGLLAFPHQIISNTPVAIAIFLFMTIIARPVSVFLIMKPAHATMMQMMTIAWAGLRGASAGIRRGKSPGVLFIRKVIDKHGNIYVVNAAAVFGTKLEGGVIGDHILPAVAGNVIVDAQFQGL